MGSDTQIIVNMMEATGFDVSRLLERNDRTDYVQVDNPPPTSVFNMSGCDLTRESALLDEMLQLMHDGTRNEYVTRSGTLLTSEQCQNSYTAREMGALQQDVSTKRNVVGAVMGGLVVE